MKITTTRITIERFTERIAYSPAALIRENGSDAAEGSQGLLSAAELAVRENLPADTENEEVETEGDTQ
jgi:hypothetical protein